MRSGTRRPGDVLESGARQRREDRRPVSSRSSCARARPPSVDLRHRAPNSTEHRQEQPADDERVLEAEDVGEDRREQATDAERAEQEELEDAEHPGEHLVGDGTLHERVARDVHEGVAGAHDREQDERDDHR